MANPPTLIDVNGNPLRRADLTREIAAPALGTVRSIQSGHPAQGLEPVRLANLLLAAEQGDAIAYFELAEEMEEKDLHYLSVMGTRKRAVSQLPIEVEPADDSRQAKDDAKFIEDQLVNRDVLEHEMFHVLDAIGKGVSSCEIIWKTSTSLWSIKDIKWRDPRWFEFDRTDGETLYLRGNAGPEPLPPAKFIQHLHPAKSGLPIRSGLARIAAWGYMFKNFAIKDWAIFLEAYGHPLRVGKYGPNESEENKRILERALRSLGVDAAAAFPETMSVEFIDRKAGTAPNDLWRSHAEYFDQQISKAVLGQTNTTDAMAGGMGSGQADVHNEVRGDIERADAKLLAATLNRDVVAPLIFLNRGPRENYPRLKIGRPDPVDIKTEVETAGQLVAMGVQIDGEELRERAGLPAAKTPESALRAPGTAGAADPAGTDTGDQKDGPEKIPPKGPQGGADAATGAGTLPPAFLSLLKRAGGANEVATAAAQDGLAEREPDFIDRTADEALDDWEPLVAPLLSSFEDLAADCTDLAQFQARLAEGLAAMDSSAFEQVLARGMFAARIAGEADRPGES